MEPGAEPYPEWEEKPENMHGKSRIRSRKPGTGILIKNMNFVMPYGKR